MPNNKFIVIEGIDRSGKTTLTKYIAENMQNTTRITFPNRESATGKLIDTYLKNDTNFNPQTIHLLFSANRWEMKDDIDSLLKTKSVICDRYYYSGVAYSVAKGLDINWCSQTDNGLIKPDITIFLDIEPNEVQKRCGFGNEKYENIEFLQKVHKNLKKLIENETNGYVIDANCSIDELNKKVVEIINKHKC